MSFDVIEHVEDPKQFIEGIYELLKDGGNAIIGTPTDAPILRELLGSVYERHILFNTQHLWIFNEDNLKQIANEVGFKKIEIKYFQRYGFENMLGWLKDKEPRADINLNSISKTMDAVFKSQCSDNKLADYIVLYAQK